MADGYLPWPSLDPWTHVVAVNWNADPITKLDFVNDKYMVAGKFQKREQVIANPEFRVDSNGLDLRGYGDDGPDFFAGPRRGSLINKVFPVTKASPGALNEFSYLDYTIVLEFDWQDRRAWWDANEGYDETWEQGLGIEHNTTPGGFDRHETILAGSAKDDTGTSMNFFAVEQGVETVDYSEQHWEILTSSEDHNEWVPAGSPFALDDYPDSLPGWNPEIHTNGPWYPYLWSISTKYPAQTYVRGKPGYVDEFDNGLVMSDIVPGDLPAGAVRWPHDTIEPWYRSTLPILIKSETPPDPYDLPQSQTVQPPLIYPPGTMARQTNTLSPYTTKDGDLSTYRLLPGASTNEAATFGIIGGQPAPYGRNRIAINVGPRELSFSVNGGDVVTTTEPADFPMPRKPTDPSNPVAPERKGFPAEKFDFSFQMTGFVRCVWLYQKTKKTAVLRKLSTVRDLPAATSPRWKTG